MANDQDENAVFLALADATRRAVIRALGPGPASVGELAQPFAMTLPSFMKHIHALEDSGLIAHPRAVACAPARSIATASRSWGTGSTSNGESGKTALTASNP